MIERIAVCLYTKVFTEKLEKKETNEIDEYNNYSYTSYDPLPVFYVIVSFF